MREGMLERVYGNAGEEIKRMLLAVEPKAMTAAKAMEIEAKARRVIAGLIVTAQAWTKENLTEAYTLAGRRARVSLEILGRKPKTHAIVKGLEKRQTEALHYLLMANGAIRKSVEQYLHAAQVAGNMLRNVPLQAFSFADAEKEFGDWAAEALKEEKSVGWLQSKIVEYLRKLVEDDNFIEVNGRMYNTRKYAEMVARTELRNVQSEATKDLCSQYENDLVEFSWHDTSCEVCKPLEKQIFSLSGSDPDYEALTDENTPPIHPNCKHSLLPTSKEALQAREIFG